MYIEEGNDCQTFNVFAFYPHYFGLIEMTTVQISDLKPYIRQISQAYLVEDEKKLTQFIVENSEIVNLLLEAQKHIRKYFLQEKLTLNVSPEYEHTEWERLEISIYVDGNNVDEALNKLSQFDNDWWLNNSSGIGLKLYIGLEFE
jgi:hypothetical protein